jgi:hypothetical protein
VNLSEAASEAVTVSYRLLAGTGGLGTSGSGDGITDA